MAYAEGTTVPVAKTRGEIEALVEKAGASRFASGWDAEKAQIQFVISARCVRFVVPMTSRDDAKKIVNKRRSVPWGQALVSAIDDTVEAEQRRRWRCLLLSVKAKLESVASGIETFEQAFLAHIVTEDGRTVHDRLTSTGGMLALPEVASKPKERTIDVG